MLTEKAYVCGHNDPAWKTATHIQCVLGQAVGITEITCKSYPSCPLGRVLKQDG